MVLKADQKWTVSQSLSLVTLTLTLSLTNLDDGDSCNDVDYELATVCIDVLEGRHLEVIKSRKAALSVTSLVGQCFSENAADSIRATVLNFIAQG
jgi:hypothetical protein